MFDPEFTTMATAGPSTAPKFFTIIEDPLADTLWVGPCFLTLMNDVYPQIIPAEFIKRYGQYLPDLVFLKVASAAALEVGLSQCDGETFLSKGWKEFRDRYSLGYGHLLFFKYYGSLQFDVVIFDTSCYEIYYPFDHVPNVRGSQKESDEVQTECYRKKLRSWVNLEPTSEEYGNGTRGKKERSFGKDLASTAYQKAASHTCLNPFFISVMKPSYVSGCFVMTLPMPFATEFLPCRKNTLSIRVSNGKAWSVNYSVRKDRANLTGGWRAFARDNALKVGDACIFEVDRTSHGVWNVIIFRS